MAAPKKKSKAYHNLPKEEGFFWYQASPTSKWLPLQITIMNNQIFFWLWGSPNHIESLPRDHPECRFSSRIEEPQPPTP